MNGLRHRSRRNCLHVCVRCIKYDVLTTHFYKLNGIETTKIVSYKGNGDRCRRLMFMQPVTAAL